MWATCGSHKSEGIAGEKEEWSRNEYSVGCSEIKGVIRRNKEKNYQE